jgi:hypothetical protein
MMKSNIRAQRASLPATSGRKSHAVAAIKHSMPAHMQPQEKPDAVKHLGTLLSATALAASLMFGGRRLGNTNLFHL